MRFDIEVQPYSDETFSSWFFRTAAANGSDPKSFALAVWKQNSLWYKDLDRHMPQNLIVRLSSQSLLSYQQIENLTLSPMIERSAPNSLADKFKWGLLLPFGQKGSVRTSGLCFCPKCLADDIPYIKKEWKTAWCTACPVHNIQLLLSCQKCGHVFSPQNLSYKQTKIYLCANCNYDLRKSDTKQPDKDAVEFQDMLSKLAFGRRKKRNFTLQFKNNKDLFLSLNIFMSFLIYIYDKDKYNDLLKALYIDTFHKFTKSNNTTFNRYSIADREYLLSCVCKIFQFDAESLIILFTDHNVSKKTLRRTYKHLSPTISYIISRLPDSAIHKPPRVVKKEITPKSKKEVDALFEEIKKFL